MLLTRALLIGTFLCFFVACDNGPDNTTDDFDRKSLLVNMADNLIKPAYNNLLTATNQLHAAAQSFAASPDLTALDNLRDAWEDAYTAWQFANAFNFGPAGEEGLQKGLIEEVGTFPVSESKVIAALSSGQWNMNDFNRDARGFLTVEYLIYGEFQTPTDILGAFATDPARSSFLTAVTADLVSRVNTVASAWNGAYYTEFINNTGTDSGSSTSQLYNEFVRSFEAIKNFKVGLPLGKRAGQTSTEPKLVEGYYSRQSLHFLKNHLISIENIWYGRSQAGVDGVGFKEYLEAVEGGGVLITNTETQLTALHAALDAVPTTPSMSEQIVGDPVKLDELHTELQKLTRYFKSDLSSLLGIAITFSSGDGD